MLNNQHIVIGYTQLDERFQLDSLFDLNYIYFVFCVILHILGVGEPARKFREIAAQTVQSESTNSQTKSVRFTSTDDSFEPA